jgi:hypothetical protein
MLLAEKTAIMQLMCYFRDQLLFALHGAVLDRPDGHAEVAEDFAWKGEY